jgi:hypothetical protein
VTNITFSRSPIIQFTYGVNKTKNLLDKIMYGVEIIYMFCNGQVITKYQMSNSFYLMGPKHAEVFSKGFAVYRK